MCAFDVKRSGRRKYVALSIDFPAQPPIFIAILDAAEDLLRVPLCSLGCFSRTYSTVKLCPNHAGWQVWNVTMLCPPTHPPMHKLKHAKCFIMLSPIRSQNNVHLKMSVSGGWMELEHLLLTQA